MSHIHTIYVQVYPTQTMYTFEQAGIQLNLTVSLHDIGHAHYAQLSSQETEEGMYARTSPSAEDASL